MLDFAIDNLLIISFIIILTSWLLLVYLNIPKDLPSGPWGLPIIGYAFFLGKKPHITVANMRKKYGDVVRINMGFEHVIFLSSYNAVKQALVNQAGVFSGRPIPKISKNLLENLGIIRSTGKIWSELRRFSLSKLRDFGFGKSSLEPRINDEIHHFLQAVKGFKGQPIPDIGEFLRQSTTNVICIVMTGDRFDYEDEMFKKLVYLSKEHVRRLGINRVLALIPRKLRFKFLIKLLRIQSYLETLSEMISVISSIVDKFEVNHVAESQNSFIDAWLSESVKKNDHSKYLTKSQLSSVLFDLFIAGGDTSTNTLGWSLLYMIAYPDVQTKVQKEIDDVIGRERTPAMSDQKLMPYTEAILMEVSRIVTLVPLAVVHCADSDATLLGKFIPKGTTVIPNLWAVHNDPELFPEPEKFKPERFLTDDGKVKRIEEFIPFSIGKRQCMGESLARMELFLYFTSMLQHLRFRKVNNQVDFDYDYSIVIMPKAQPIYAEPRELISIED